MPRQLRAHMMLQPAAHNRAQENLILSEGHIVVRQDF